MSGIDLHRGFDLTSPFVPMGDQPRAIAELTEGMARGERYQTLLGATGTGKSVGYDDPVFVAERTPQGLVPRLLPIGQLIDEAMEAHPPAKGADGTEVLDLPGDRYFTQAYDPETGEVGLFPVSAFTRHTTPDTMYDLETSCGRSITLTGDHNLWVLRDGALRLIETADARPTDYVPLPERVPELSTRTSLNTLQVLRGERLFVDARTALLEYIEAEGVGALASSMKTAGLSHPYTKIKALRDQAKGRGRLTMDAMQQVLAETDDLGGHWRADEARIGGQAPYNDVPASLTMTPSFMRLVGYYIAEGCQARGYFVMANRDPGVRQDIEDALTDLGLPFSVRPSSDYQISSTALTRMLHHLCGDDARGKRLPDFWPTLPQHLLAVLLRAYFDGDGTVGHASDVTATTASADLASDLAYALFRFGIWARISRRHKRATNSEHAGDWYYQVTVSGQANLHRYAEAIGFSIPRKQEALARQMDRTSNSNVDVVPIDGSQLRWLRQHVQLSANVLGERS
ncbi:MAG: LAGLIDADG family homing endonuclease, partial [Bacteroidota bacterium]